MSAIWNTMSQPAMFAGKNRTQRMPSPKNAFAMCTPCAAIASILLIGTGVVTSVSLFVLALSLVLLALLVVLISLILSGLTGLIGLVGLTEGLAPGTTKGD
ncbi:MAG TPA: hypothetical protein VJO32_15630 [Ktedonobacteraceae bacterium]|nr:hypothetical protein [Ktedonobacteraceae bacterium]